MPRNEERRHRLNAEEAARIIYGTQEPDWRQVGQVRAMILRGVIQGSKDGRWTTADAVAEYLAAANLHRGAERNRRAAASGQSLPRDGSPSQREYRSTYRDVLKEYFLAVIRRRDRRQYSRSFQGAILAGQIALLIGLVTVGALVFHAVRKVPEPQELATVRQWLEQNTDRHQIVQWYAPEPVADGQGLSIRVVYEYAKVSPKTIRTDRVFVIEGGQVVSVESHK
jgi:hypothetical protein